MCVSVYLCIHICLCWCVHVDLCVLICKYLFYVFTCIFLCVHLYMFDLCLHIYVCVSVCLCEFICISVYLYAFMCVCVSVCTPAHMSVETFEEVLFFLCFVHSWIGHSKICQWQGCNLCCCPHCQRLNLSRQKKLGWSGVPWRRCCSTLGSLTLFTKLWFSAPLWLHLTLHCTPNLPLTLKGSPTLSLLPHSNFIHWSPL